MLLRKTMSINKNELGFMIMDVMRQLDTVLMDGTQEFASIYPLHHRAKMLTFKKN